VHGLRIPAQTHGGPSRYSLPATGGLAPKPDCLTMYASLYDQLRYRPPFADFRVNLRDGTTGIFACQRERALRMTLRGMSCKIRVNENC